MNNADMPAHPIVVPGDAPNSVDLGLTKREYFAAMAMQGLIASGISSVAASDIAVGCADELLEELAK